MLTDPTLPELLQRVRRLAARPASPRVLIGLAGPPGVGKSTLAESLVAGLGRDVTPSRDSQNAGGGAVLVALDGFHLPAEELARRGLRDRLGAPETFDAGGYLELMSRVRSGGAALAPGFDRTTERVVPDAVEVSRDVRIVVSEGNYLLLDDEPWPAVRRIFDEVWLLRADPALRRRRLVGRHVRFGKEARQADDWVIRVDEDNARRIAEAAGARLADLVVEVR